MANKLDEDDLKALHRIDVIVGGLIDATARPPSPEPGSELQHDDQATALPGYASSIVSSAMTTAACGLQGFQALCMGIEKFRRSITFGYVHRAALLGACEAYWVLRPDDMEVRIQRANHVTLRLLNDEIASKSDIQTMTMLFQDDRMVTDDELVELRKRRDECSRVVGRKPETFTQIFKEAATDLENDSYFQGYDAEHLSQVLRSQWRISSADAHGRIWQHRFNDPLAPETDPGSPPPQRVADLSLIIEVGS